MTYQLVGYPYIFRNIQTEYKNRTDRSIANLIDQLCRSVLFEQGITYTGSAMSVVSKRIRHLSSKPDMTLALLAYVLLSTSNDDQYTPYRWSIYDVHGIPIVRGERKIILQGRNRYLLPITNDALKSKGFSDELPICDARQAIELQQQIYGDRVLGGERPLASIGRAENLLGELTPLEQSTLESMFRPKGDIYGTMTMLGVHADDREIIKADAISYRLLSVYERVFKMLPNPACRVYPPIPKRDFKYDIDFIFQ